MLNITTLSDPKAALHYFQSPDYYAEDVERSPSWHGELAKHFGLQGTVDMETFGALCRREHPQTHESLTTAKREDADFARDFTFSPPKSVSLAWAIGGDQRIADVCDRTAEEVMKIAERDVLTRVRKQGQNTERSTGNWLYAMFPHFFARPENGLVDPQYHNHCVVFNITHDPIESELKAIQHRELKRNAPLYQAMYRALLSEKLQRLGYHTRQVIYNGKDYSFEIDGIPAAAITQFSQRSAKINDVARQLDARIKELHGPDASLSSQAKAKLAATTRSAKLPGRPWEALLASWEARLTPEDLATIRETTEQAKEGQPKQENAKAVNYALQHCLYRESAVPERDIVKEALRFGCGSVTLKGIYRELERPDIIRDKGMISASWVKKEEDVIADFARKGRGTCKPLNPKPDLSKLLTLSPSQREAVLHVWRSPDRVMLVEGYAGVGKTTATGTILPAINTPFVILAPSAKVGRGVLRENFKDADTLATFFLSEKLQQKARNGLIVLDEAGMAGSEDVAKLTRLAAQLNSRLLLLGDRGQMKSVARGDIFRTLTERANLPVAVISEIQRQKGEYAKIASLLAGAREKPQQAGQALDRLDNLGWVVETSDPLSIPREARDSTGELLNPVEDYIHWNYQRKKETLLAVPTHAEGERVTQAIRTRLKELGYLGEEREFTRLVNLQWTPAEIQAAKERKENVVFNRYGAFRQETIRIAVGDKIQTTAGGQDSSKKHRINNGTTYTVTAFDAQGRPVLDNGWTLPTDFQHWRHGYVETAFGAQGATKQRVTVIMTQATLPAVDMRAAYVTTSRGKEMARIYTNDKAELRDRWGTTRKHVLASDLRPRKSRLKRHISFLRDMAARVWEKVSQPTQQLEMEIDR